MELILALRKNKPFAEIHYCDLHAIIDKFSKQIFNKGDFLIKEGELPNGIGILCEGSATAVSESKAEKSYDINSSEIFGSDCLLKNEVSDVSIVCNQRSTVFILETDAFFETIGRFPSIRTFFYHIANKKSHIRKTKPNHPQYIQTALQYIDINFAEQIRLDDIASEAGISKYYLSRLFRKTTGCSFKQLLNIRRINTAKRLMLEEGKNVSEACYAVGFNNLSYFIRVYKKYEKMRPSDNRNRAKKKNSYD